MPPIEMSTNAGTPLAIQKAPFQKLEGAEFAVSPMNR